MVEVIAPSRPSPRRHVWAVWCLGLVMASWVVLAFLAVTDGLFSTDSAMNSAFDPVYSIYAALVVAAPILGAIGLAAIRARGQAWLAWTALALALLMPAAHLMAILSLGGNGIGPPA